MRWVLVSLALLAVPLCLDACAKTPPAPKRDVPAPAPIESASRLRKPAAAAALTPPNVAPEPALAAFDLQCGECHRSDLDTAKPKALAIFDMTHEGWLSKMTAPQLKVSLHRFEGKSEAERKDAMALLDAELARR